MAETKIWRIEREEYAGAMAEQSIQAAALQLKNGGIVAFPTETVYGLGADAGNTAAVEKIFAAKGRPSDNPLIVHIAEASQLETIVRPLGRLEKELMDRFWPGPLTLVLPVMEGAVSPRVTAGLSTVAVRMPAHDVALRLIRAAGCPVAAPSANRSGRPSPTLAGHVIEDLSGRIDGIVDGGPTGVGLESTVAEIAEDGVTIRILRPGGLTAEALGALAPVLLQDAGEYAAGEAEVPRTPGAKYTHYAPEGEMRLVQGEHAAVRSRIQAEVDAARVRGEKTGVLTFAEHALHYSADLVLACGSLSQLETAAQGLYAALREFDAQGVQAIWAEACPQEGIGLALMNRLVKAAGHRVIRVG